MIFSCGACYSIGGSLQKVSSYIFILTPASVEISGDIQDILNGAVPSIRTGVLRNAMEREALFIKKMEETADNAYQRGIVSFSDFLDLYEQHLLQRIDWQSRGVSLRLFGGYDAAERRMAAFCPQDLRYSWEYPFSCLRIRMSAPRYSRPLTHRDYLGAALGLGIERRVIGGHSDGRGGGVFILRDRNGGIS